MKSRRMNWVFIAFLEGFLISLIGCVQSPGITSTDLSNQRNASNNTINNNPVTTSVPSPPNSTPSPSSTPFPVASIPPGSASSGTLHYHFYPSTSSGSPVTSASALGESLNLQGESYTDLIFSNFISGVLLGRSILEIYPGLQFNKDYLYGTMWAQLLQENLNSWEYASPACPNSSKMISPCPDQSSVMGMGQGGPYQLNNFAFDQIYNTPSPSNNPGFSLLNYVAIQQNLQITFAQLSVPPFNGATPASFNSMYFGPMLAAYFHLNDVASLIALGQVAWTPPVFAANFAACLNNLKSISNSPLDVILNYAYNQGYYGKLIAASTELCAKNVSSFISLANGTLGNPYSNAVSGFNNGVESNSSYTQYPYQIRFYLDELYNKSTLQPQTTNHVVMNAGSLGNLFASVMGTLGYRKSNGSYFPPATILATSNGGSQPWSVALQAYSLALSKLGISLNTTLDLSNAGNRATIFTLLENSISNLEQSTGMNYSQKTTSQLF